MSYADWSGSDLDETRAKGVPQGLPLWPALLIAAILLVPFDTLCRRVG